MWRTMQRATSGLAALLLISTAGCVDLEVQNPNAPDAARALATPSDIEALIGGAFSSWWDNHFYSGIMMALSNASGQHAAPWANSGMEYYARIPRVSTVNQAGDPYIGNITNTYYDSYRAIAAVAQGLNAIEELKSVPDGPQLSAEQELRATAYGRFMMGVAHGYVAALYDSGIVYDETKSPVDTLPRVGYTEVMQAALAWLDEAASLAHGASFTVPGTWMSQDVSAAKLEQLAHSWAAILRSSVARTPTERAAVDWDQVTADVNAGITEDWDFVGDWNVWYDEALWYATRNGWAMDNNWVHGMADQSGAYQSWITTPLSEKQPFLFITPDTRYPQGADEATQIANRGDYFHVITGSERVWSRPDRGTWRWSYYRTSRTDSWISAGRKGPIPLVSYRQMRLLLAEAAYRSGNLAQAAAIVNETRTLHGLNATDAAGTNTSCVPKMPPTHPTNPNGCGDLWEMLKWEARMEYGYYGLLRVPAYFDSRGWGDLMEGTILQFPVPYREMELLNLPFYDLGGVGGNWGAPVGTYGY